MLRASRQWRDLTNRMQSGFGHKPVDEHGTDGSMAIFCPACPQPGINLPMDWKIRYNKYAEIIYMAYAFIDAVKGISSLGHLLWMETSLQSICDLGQRTQMFRFLQEWLLWPTLSCSMPILEAWKNHLKYALHWYWTDLFSLLCSQAHAIHTEL